MNAWLMTKDLNAHEERTRLPRHGLTPQIKHICDKPNIITHLKCCTELDEGL